jgi:pSer/pThr/pTyr-binding forkhead associated (FHA) protein
MPKLVLRMPDGGRREFPLERERLTIGRRADNDICLPFPAVSGEHAAVVTILDDSFLEDLGSTNGTLVNGKAITKHFLRDYDEIDIGRQMLVYVSGDYVIPEQTPLPAVDETVAVTANGGATIGDDEATVVYSTRSVASGVQEVAVPTQSAAELSLPDTPSPLASLPDDADARRDDTNDARGYATLLEVLDGPRAGVSMAVTGDNFVVGRVGLQIAALRKVTNGFRLVPLEGNAVPCVNGQPVAAEGAVLSPGDELEIAGTRLAYRSAS